jgi:hypothetical protein
MSTPTIPGATATVIKPQETTGKRGRKPGSQVKERQEIPADQFKIESVGEESRGYVRRQRLERSKQQQAVDIQVMKVWQEWEAAGSPRKWTDMPVKRWVINRQFAEDAQFMLAKAVNLHGKKLVTGKLQEKPLPNLPLGPNEVGIPFCVISRAVKTEGVPGSETEGDSESAAPESE